MSPTSFPFSTTRRVEFCQTDAGGILHFSSFFQMMEQAEHEMLRGLGMSVIGLHEGRHLSWPRVSATCDFQKPARFEDVIEIHIGIARMGNRSLTYTSEFRLAHDLAHDVIAVGKMVVACCIFEPGKTIRSIDIPDDIRQRLAPCVLKEQDD